MTRVLTSSGIRGILVSGIAAVACAAVEQVATAPAPLTTREVTNQFCDRMTRIADFHQHAAHRTDFAAIGSELATNLAKQGMSFEVLESQGRIFTGEEWCELGRSEAAHHFASPDRQIRVDIVLYPDSGTLDVVWKTIRVPSPNSGTRTSDRRFYFTHADDENCVAGAVFCHERQLINIVRALPTPVPFDLDRDAKWSQQERRRIWEATTPRLDDVCALARIVVRQLVDPQDLIWMPSESSAGRLTAEERVIGFIDLWTEVKYSFAFFEKVPDLNWDRVRRRYLPRVREDQSDEQYHLLLQECMALLKDGHTEMLLARPHHCPALRIDAIEGRVIITEVAPSEETQRTAVKPGMEITHIDRRSVREILEQDIYPWVSASTPQGRDRRAWRQLLEGPADSSVTLTIQNLQRTSREVTLPRVDPRNLPWVTQHRAVLDFDELDGDILCVSLNSFSEHRVVDEFDRIFDRVRAARGLILDVRENGGGSSGHGYAIISRLIDEPLESSRWKTRQYLPVVRAWGREQGWHEHGPGTVSPRGDDLYLGPIVVLIGPDTASAAEDFLVPLHAGKRATLVGEKTCGSTGQPLIVDVPGGARARICTKWDSYPDGHDFVGVGVIPDVEVHPTREDVAAGRDVVLERGIEVLQRMMRDNAVESKVE